MSKQTDNISTANISINRDELSESLNDIFARYAIENRGIMMSPHRAPQVTSRLVENCLGYLSGQVHDADVAETAVQLAEQGMAYVSASRLIQGLNAAFQENDEIAQAKLATFQFLFLEQFANARELVQLKIQENSQMALQHALQQQIEQQRLSNLEETRRSENLNEILALNSTLASISNKSELATEAVIGLCRALDLVDVTFLEESDIEGEWHFLATSTSIDPDKIKLIFAPILSRISKESTIYSEEISVDGQLRLGIVSVFSAAGNVFRGLLVQAKYGDIPYEQTLKQLIQTFSQNVASLWQQLHLLDETRERAKELEIYYGRYIDEIWQDEQSQLEAAFVNGSVVHAPYEKDKDNNHTLELDVGGRTIGEVQLPDNASLTPEDEAIVRAIIEEMSDALNNAQLIQKTRSYSNQLAVAASVSQAAATILDQEELISTVVELVREQFDFYYVGLFLIDEDRKTAVLKAGTGKAGRIQLERNHHQIIGGGSMIGAAAEDGDPRVEQDVTKAEAFAPNELLPLTQSELALPLTSRDEIIGALTVQSVEKNAFSETAVAVLSSLASQLAIAIDNARLLARTQTNLATTNQLYESARIIGAAQSEQEVFRELVTFARESQFADIIHVIAEDPFNHYNLLFPVLWSDKEIEHDPTHIYPKEEYTLIKTLENNEIVFVNQNDDETLGLATKKLYQAYGVQNAIYLSLSSKEQWLGAVALLSCSETLPTQQALQPFFTLIDHAAIILANQRLLNQSNLLYTIGRELNQTLTRDSAIEIIVREVGRYVGASQCRFVLYNHRTGIGEVTATLHATENHQFELRGDKLLLEMMKDSAPRLHSIDDETSTAEHVKKHLDMFGSKHSYFVPCSNQTELIGYLMIDLAQGKRPFSPNNILFIQTLVSHLTTQIENIKLFDEALDRAQELITLNQIQSNISKLITVEPLAKIAYSEIGRLLSRDIYHFSLYDSDSEQLTPIYTNHNGNEIKPSARTLKPTDQIHTLLKEKNQKLTDHSSTLTQSEAKHMGIPTPQSALWMPLLDINDDCIGLLTIQSYTPQAYVEDDRQLLRSIATQTSLALTNAQLFETIQAKNKELQQLDQLKTQFLANMSHELRTPLNSIIGFSRVILKGIDGPITKEQEEDLSSIHTNGQHLLTLINEILDMAKIGAGKMTLSFDQVDITQSAKIATTTVRPLIDESKIKFIWDVPNQLPMIYADPVRIRQILINLLSNAAKYTQAGHIQLTIREETSKSIHIIVSDTGIGIAEQDYDKLFTAFEQVDNSTTRSVGGTGLGLPITKWIVDMHHGQIWFESEANKGTNFHVTLPIENQPGKNLSLEQTNAWAER